MNAEKGSVRITAETGMNLLITFVDSQVIRCKSWWGDTEPSADSYMSRWEPLQEMDIEAEDGHEEIKLKAAGVTVHVQKSTGTVTWEKNGEVFLQERDKQPGALELTMDTGHIWGLGQQQQAINGYEGQKIPLLHLNTSITVPFITSAAGFSLLWNSSAKGEADFTEKGCLKLSSCGKQDVDYLVFLSSPMESVQQFWKLTGPGQMLPKWAFGFWQSKMRYTSQEELTRVAETYREKKYPMDIIVVDFYHWTQMGDFTFDSENWPEPEKMMQDLKDLHVKCMVSVWPHISTRSFNYEEMKEKGYFIKNQTGESEVFPMFNKDDNGLYDPFSQEAREFVFQKAKGYYESGARIWWLDGCEPEVDLEAEDGTPFMSCEGPLKNRVLAFPLMHAKTFYDGQRALDPDKRVISFARSTFAGAQRYGVCVWSGDVGYDFKALRSQIAAGLSAAVSGLPFWTTDIGGFTGGNPEDEAYRELYIRWFQYGAFCSLFRVHGSRGAKSEDDLLYGISRGENELWSFGKQAEKILVRYDRLRYMLLPYIYTQAQRTTSQGIPMMQPLFLRHSQEEKTWDIKDQYYFGEALMVCPVVEENARGREVYFPGEGKWYDFWTGKTYMGGECVWVEAALDTIPVFVKEHTILCMKDVEMYTDEKPQAPVYAAVFGDTAQGYYYNDDGETYDYQKGSYEEKELRFEKGLLYVCSRNEGGEETIFQPLTEKEITDFIYTNLG